MQRVPRNGAGATYEECGCGRQAQGSSKYVSAAGTHQYSNHVDLRTAFHLR